MTPRPPHTRTPLPLLIQMALILLLAGAARAQAPVDPLIQELEGQGPARARSQADALAAYSKALEILAPAMAGGDLKSRGEAQDAWEKICHHAARPGSLMDRAAVAAAMIPGMEAGKPMSERIWLLKMTERIGAPESVSALAKLLDDPDADIRERARRALQVNEAAAAATALRSALAATKDPAWQTALVNALGARRDPEMVPELVKLLDAADAGTAAGAAAALGRIGGADAVAGLSAHLGGADAAFKRIVANSLLAAAEIFTAESEKEPAAAIYQSLYAVEGLKGVHLAALRGLAITRGLAAVPVLVRAMQGANPRTRIAAVRFSAEVRDPGATAALADALSQVPEDAQAALIDELASRKDPQARPAVIKALKSESPIVRAAAIRALGMVGGKDDVEMLAGIAAAPGPDSTTARESLAALRGADIDDSIITDLPAVSPPNRAELVRALGARHAPAREVLVRALNDPDSGVRLAAINSLALLADEQAQTALLKLLTSTKQDEERTAAEAALASIQAAAKDPQASADALVTALNGTTGVGRAALLRVLSSAGGAKALAAVQADLQNTDPDVQDAAFHSLAAWPDLAAAPTLLTTAKTETNKSRQILAVRGYIRLAGSPTLAGPDRFVMYRTADSLIHRPEERKLWLGGLGSLASLDALNLATASLDDGKVREEAAAAAISIVGLLGKADVKVERAAIRKVLDVSTNKNNQKTAKDAQKKLKG